MPQVVMSKHEDVTFRNQTVYLSGQAFLRCTFVDCTLVLRQAPYHFDGCRFERCNWHLDWILMWGAPDSVRVIKDLVTMIEKAQEQLGQQPGQPGSTSSSSPFGSRTEGNGGTAPAQ